jgi:hypothetical protein
LLCRHSNVGISMKFVGTSNFLPMSSIVLRHRQHGLISISVTKLHFVIWLWFTACESFVFVGFSRSLLVYCPVMQGSLGCIPFTHHFWSTCQSHEVSGKLNLSSVTRVEAAVNCATVAVVSCFGLPGLWSQMYQLIRWKKNILGGPHFGCLRSEGK